MNVSVTPPFIPQPLGQHVIAEFYGAEALVEGAPAEAALRDAAQAAGAIVLEVRQHDFGARAGFTAFAVLAESHISIHTWPEHGYAAIDIFMCGDVDTDKSLDVLRAYFKPASEQVQVLTRGCPTVLSQVLIDPKVAV